MDSFILNEHGSRSSTLPSNNLLLQLLFLNRLLFYLFFIATRDSIFEYSFTFNNINFERCSNTHTKYIEIFRDVFDSMKAQNKLTSHRKSWRGEGGGLAILSGSLLNSDFPVSRSGLLRSRIPFCM